jgi:uncharacterized protein YdaU (DUF1376 family)
MGKTSTWMPIYIGDYLKDTMHLSAEEHGAYILLIMHYWVNGPIKNDEQYMLTVARIKPSRVSRKTLSTVSKFFELKNGYYHHSRIDKEHKEAAENSLSRAEAARNAANARWGKNDADSNANAMRGACPSPSPNTVKKHPLPLNNVDRIVDNSSGEKGATDCFLNNFSVLSMIDDKTFDTAKKRCISNNLCWEDIVRQYDAWIKNTKKKIPDHVPSSFIGFVSKKRSG